MALWQGRLQRQFETLHSLVPHARTEPEIPKPAATATLDVSLVVETLAAERDALSEELNSAVDEQARWAAASVQATRTALTAAAELFAPAEMRRRFESERIKHSWLIMHCETLLCKLALLDVQFKAETYPQQKNKALQVIAEIARAGLADARRAYSDLRCTLDGYSPRPPFESALGGGAIPPAHIPGDMRRGGACRYEAVGPGFNALVEQYRTLLEELHHKQWALGEVQK
jgi:hypothetical protein